MANYATLKAAIQQVVKTNGNNEITGALLQQSLLAMINSLGGYYQFAGIATPSTNPGTPDQNVFYIGGAGTYSNFSGLVIPTGYIGVLKYNGTWTIETVQAGDVNAVKFVAQTLTDNQKTQARTNIEAASNAQVSQLEAKVGELENGEKQVLTFLRGSTPISCDFKQGHIYKCIFARYTPYASESPRAMKLTLSASGVTSSYIPTESGVNLAYGESYYFYSPNNYTAVNSYTEGTAEWDVYDITEKYEGVFQMMRNAEYSAGGNAQYDSLGNITQQDIIWSNSCIGILTKTLFDEDVFEYKREEATCINAVAGKFSYKATFDKNYDEFGNIANEIITITKI